MAFFTNSDFAVRFSICFASVLVLVKIYFHFYQHRENSVAFVLFGFGVFVVIYLLHSAQVSMGFAFGLFAIFSMLRYRTEAMGIKEMTYLFLVISIALLSAVAPLSYQALCFVNAFMALTVLVLELGWLFPRYDEKEVEYERIENIKPENRRALYDDLSQRTGLTIVNVEVISISFLKDTALLRMHYLRSRS